MSKEQISLRAYQEMKQFNGPFTRSDIRGKCPKEWIPASINNAFNRFEKKDLIQRVGRRGKETTYKINPRAELRSVPERGSLQDKMRERIEELKAQRLNYDRGMARCDNQIKALEEAIDKLNNS